MGAVDARTWSRFCLLTARPVYRALATAQNLRTVAEHEARRIDGHARLRREKHRGYSPVGLERGVNAPHSIISTVPGRAASRAAAIV